MLAQKTNNKQHYRKAAEDFKKVISSRRNRGDLLEHCKKPLPIIQQKIKD